jgi:hypothetical protein
MTRFCLNETNRNEERTKWIKYGMENKSLIQILNQSDSLLKRENDFDIFIVL